MKKHLLSLVMFFAMLIMQAQEYNISFQAAGGSILDSVQVENLNQGTFISVAGTDALQLAAVNTGIKPVGRLEQGNIQVYPNPITDAATITFNTVAPGAATIELLDVSGRKVFSETQNLSAGMQSFTVNGIGRGNYLLRVVADTYTLVSRLSSVNPAHSSISVRFRGMQSTNKSDIPRKSGSSGKYFQYNEGDILVFTGNSGLYRTVVPLIPTGDTLITFNFVPCMDVNGNNYAVVQIGNQLWMAENLKTSRYLTGETVDSVADNTAWGGLSSGAYSSYENEATNSDLYGHLYNWYAAKDNRSIAPYGWHVPSDAEWHRMIRAIDKNATLIENQAESFTAGGKLKATGTSLWNGVNTGATNEYGFSALPGGARNPDGTYDFSGSYAHWWSTDQKSTDQAWLRYVAGDGIDFERIPADKKYGLSVRCVHDTMAPKGYLTINGTKYDLHEGFLGYFGNFEGAGVYNHGIMLYNSTIDINWSDFTVNGAGPIIDFEIFNTGNRIESGIYNFSIPEIADSIKICRGIDLNDDGIIDENDCQETLVEGTYYISSRLSFYGSNLDLNDDGYDWPLFDTGTVTIEVSGSRYTITFDCTSTNMDKISGYYEGNLNYFDWSEEPGKKSKETKQRTIYRKLVKKQIN